MTTLVLFYLTLHIQGMSPVGLEDQESLWQRHFAVPSSGGGGGGGSALDLLPRPGSSLSEQGKGKNSPGLDLSPQCTRKKPLPRLL